MSEPDDRQAPLLENAMPEPPHDLESGISPAPRGHRKRLLAGALAAAAVAAVAIGIPLAMYHVTTRSPLNPRGPAVHSLPAGFTASDFRLASPPGQVIGGLPMPRPICKPHEISAIAATRRTEGGVLGVLRLVGAVVRHRDGVAERCALPIARGPSALLGMDGRRLKVPLSGGDRTSPPGNPRPDIALHYGNAIWGFAWLGSYCGSAARTIEIPLDHGSGAPLRVPLHGPQPRCQPAMGASVLIDGVAGAPGEPVQPPRPDYSSLRLAGHIEPGTTSGRLAAIDLTLRTTGSKPITVDPCPAYSGRDYATAHSGGFSDSISSGYLPCIKKRPVIRPGHPLRWTVPVTSLLQTPGTGAIPGSTIYVQIGIAGVPSLRLKTTAGR